MFLCISCISITLIRKAEFLIFDSYCQIVLRKAIALFYPLLVVYESASFSRLENRTALVSTSFWSGIKDSIPLCRLLLRSLASLPMSLSTFPRSWPGLALAVVFGPGLHVLSLPVPGLCPNPSNMFAFEIYKSFWCICHTGHSYVANVFPWLSSMQPRAPMW